MKKFQITVNGVSYEVDVEEIKEGFAPTPKPVQAAPVAAPTISQPAPKAETKAAAPTPQAAPAAAPKAPITGGVNITSPMPGNILRIAVKPGDQIKEGDLVLILEAMKMENEIVAPQNGVVAAVQVNEGATVNGGDVLVIIQ